MGANIIQDKIQLLSDVPADEDFFGGHKETALAIVDTIETNSAGKILGILGGWGSGKSTVVHQVTNIFETINPDTKVFVFDAWAHHGDPLRRSFLEKLIHEFVSDENKREDIWRKDLDKISKRTEETTVTKTPILTQWGTAFAISLFFMTVGIAILRSSEATEAISSILSNFLNHQKLEGWLQLNAFVWIIMPLIVAVFSQLYFLCGRKDESSEKWNAGTMFLNRYQETEKTNTIKTADTTSIEFQEIFTKFIKRHIEEDGLKLVVVIDNLDRLEREEALELWSSVRSFFVGKDEKTKSLLKEHLWIIVPIDNNAVNNIFSDNLNAQDSVNKSDILLSTDRVQSFIEKTFNATFRLGPPILSDWLSYFEAQFKIAFGNNISDKDLDIITRLYDAYYENSTSAIITPRKIKAFINNLAVSYLRWKHADKSIHIQYQALYILYKNEIENSVKYILLANNNVIPQQAINALNRPDEWQKYIVSIYFNISEPERALELLIQDDLIKDIYNENEENLKNYQKVMPKLPRLIEREVERKAKTWVSSHPEILVAFANKLEKLSASGHLKLNPKTWDYMCFPALDKIKWTKIDDETLEGLKTLIVKCPHRYQAKLSKHLLSSLNELNLTQQNGKYNISPGNWFQAFSILEDKVKLHDTKYNWDNFSLSLEADFLINAMLFGSYRNNDSFKTIIKAIKKYETLGNQPQSRFENKVCNLIKTSDIDKNLLSIIEYLSREWKELSWSNISMATSENIQKNKTSEENSLYAYKVLALCDSHNDNNVPNVITNLSKKGMFFNSLYHAKDRGDIPCQALCISLSIKYNPTGNLVNTATQFSKAGIQVFHRYLANPEDHSLLTKDVVKFSITMLTYNELISANKQLANLSKISQLIFKKMLNTDITKPTPNILISDYAHYKRLLPKENFFEFLSDLHSEHNLIDYLENQNFDCKPLLIYRDLLDSKVSFLSSTLSFLKRGFKKISAIEYKNMLDNQDERLEVLLRLSEADKNAFLDGDFETALINHSLEILKSARNEPNLLNDKWQYLPNTILSGSFYNYIRKHLLSASYTLENKLKIINLYSLKIFKKSTEAESRTFIKDIVLPLIKSHNLAYQNYVIANATTIKSHLKTRQISDFLNAELIDLMNGSSSPHLEKIIDIASHLKRLKAKKHGQMLLNENSE